MTSVAVLGASAVIQGYALAGAVPVVAETREQVREEWTRLPSDVIVVILTPTAAAALSTERAAAGAPMTVVMPG
jgi:vacuolar-type H+-ATPase subunit F/Vma7